jgi:tRNA-modifying protein YgfZ
MLAWRTTNPTQSYNTSSHFPTRAKNMTSPWIEFLTREGAILQDSSIRFAATEPVPARDATVVVPLLHLGLIRSTGTDSATFLHNLLSNDVRKLADDAVQWNSFNTPKGRMLASMLLWREPEGHMLALSADIHPAILKRLSMYVLRSKVALGDAGPDTALVGVSGPGAEAILLAAELPVPPTMHQAASGTIRCIRLDNTTFVVAVPLGDAPRIYGLLVGAGATRAGTSAWQLAMIRAGLPLITASTQEEFVAQMLNYEIIGGVNFHKGCYPGQEIVARTQYLGRLKKRMYRVHVSADQAPLPGADIFTPEFGEQSAGKVVNVAPSPDGGYEALAVMQMTCAEANDARLGSPAGPKLEFLDLPYTLS